MAKSILRAHLDSHEQNVLRTYLARYDGNQAHAARALGISPANLRRRLDRLGQTEWWAETYNRTKPRSEKST